MVCRAGPCASRSLQSAADSFVEEVYGKWLYGMLQNDKSYRIVGRYHAVGILIAHRENASLCLVARNDGSGKPSNVAESRRGPSTPPNGGGRKVTWVLE